MKSLTSRRPASILPALALVLALAGCGTADKPKSASETADAMYAALAATPCTQMELDMNLDMRVSGAGVSAMALGMDLATSVTLCCDPVSSYALAAVDLDLEGQPIQTTAETYTVMEGGALVTYTCTGGIWTKTAAGQTPEALLESASAVQLDSASLRLDETITEWDGVPAVCLVTTIAGPDMQDILGMLIQSAGSSSAEDLDLSAVTCSARIYLNAETNLPIAEEIEISGMSHMMAAALGQADAEVEVTACTAAITFQSYEAQEAVVLPEGAAENAAAWERLLSGEPNNGDGTYTIREGMVLIDVAIPEGFEVTDADYDHVTAEQPGNARRVTYTMYVVEDDGSMAGTYFTSMMDKTVSRQQQAEPRMEREQIDLETGGLSFSCDLLSTTWSSGRTEADFLAWTPLHYDGGTGYYLLVEVLDGFSTGLVGGVEKNADITAEEFVSYLSAAASSAFMA
jgi:hypothetical protein